MSESKAVVRPARSIQGSLRPPGDKSISHRYAMLAAIARGTTRLTNFSTGADCASTLSCLKGLGIEITRNGDEVVIEGGALTAPAASLDCGNSGSTMRMLSGIVAAQSFTSHLTGDASLSRRPMARIITPLELMGASITASDGDRPPLEIRGGALHGITYKMPVASAQVKTCLLFAGLLAHGETTVEEPVRTRDHGELALRAFGAQIKRRGNECRITGGQELHGIEVSIPGDISTAAFFLCAAGLFPGSQLIVSGVLLNPTRARLLDVLVRMGMKITITQVDEVHGELVGTVQAEGKTLLGGTISGAETAALIDEIPVLAAIAPFTEEGIEIRDARELRVKESDRIASLARNLRAMGAEVDEQEHGLKIPGRQTLRGAEIDSFGDHRIAMAFAIAALRAEGETTIRNADAAAVSYPAFFDVLNQLAQR
jgi:3-phosphoshikimate 1-carboxyvinyltransferase